jgi:Uma2 family endonuclease
MGKTAAKRMTVEEFFDWAPKDDTRWELIDGRPVAMAPASQVHGQIVARLARRIGEALDTRPGCRIVINSGIQPQDKNDNFFEADLAVACTPVQRGERAMDDPVLLVEVLSPSTEATDRLRKLPDYRAIPSVREIVFLQQDAVYAEVHRRLEGGVWLTDLVLGRDARLRLESIGLDVALADVYVGVPLDEAEGA